MQTLTIKVINMENELTPIVVKFWGSKDGINFIENGDNRTIFIEFERIEYFSLSVFDIIK